jgi:hypothetical protein
VTFTCPRCWEPVEDESFFGPCASCRGELVETQFSVPNEHTRKWMTSKRRYTPKMNVTPNHVATKE